MHFAAEQPTPLSGLSQPGRRSPKHSRPDVDIAYCGRSGYWLVDIKCKDRAKLLFDTVCTLADCGYDVFHATIDSPATYAHQEVRDPRAWIIILRVGMVDSVDQPWRWGAAPHVARSYCMCPLQVARFASGTVMLHMHLAS